jgi:hypothetical protein
VLALGIAGEFTVLFGASSEIGIGVDISSGDWAIYKSKGKTKGVNAGVGIKLTYYKNGLSSLSGSYKELSAALLAFGGSIIPDSKGFGPGTNLQGLSGSVGKGIPAGASISNSKGSVISSSCRN